MFLTLARTSRAGVLSRACGDARNREPARRFANVSRSAWRTDPGQAVREFGAARTPRRSTLTDAGAVVARERETGPDVGNQNAQGFSRMPPSLCRVVLTLIAMLLMLGPGSAAAEKSAPHRQLSLEAVNDAEWSHAAGS